MGGFLRKEYFTQFLLKFYLWTSIYIIMSHSIRLIFPAICCLFFYAASAQKYRPATFSDSARIERILQLTPQLDSIFSQYARQKKLPSIAYGIVADGRLLHSYFQGESNLEKNISASSLTAYHIASMTKSITAMAILKLRDAHLLRLDDPISTYIPEATNMKPLTSDAPEITIRHLLTHHAGFPEDNPWGDRQLGRTDEFLEHMYEEGISFSTAPGTGYEYSNLGFATLGLIITKVSGMPYQQYIHENIFQPLRMAHTYWDYEEAPEKQLVIGYRLVNGKWVPQPMLNSGSFGAMGGLITTIEDFSKYMAFHLSAWPPRNDLEKGPVKRSSVREMHHGWNFNRIRNAEGSCPTVDFYCYGLHRYEDCNGKVTITHSGGLPGYGSQWRILPDYGVGIVCFANLTYAPVGAPTAEALNAMVKWAELKPRVLPASDILEKRKKQLLDLLPAWENAASSGIFADNFFDDYFITDLKRNYQNAFQKMGKIVSVSVVHAENQLRGYFIIHGENSDYLINFTLSPEEEPKIQELGISLEL